MTFIRASLFVCAAALLVSLASSAGAADLPATTDEARAAASFYSKPRTESTTGPAVATIRSAVEEKIAADAAAPQQQQQQQQAPQNIEPAAGGDVIFDEPGVEKAPVEPVQAAPASPLPLTTDEARGAAY